MKQSAWICVKLVLLLFITYPIFGQKVNVNPPFTFESYNTICSGKLDASGLKPFAQQRINRTFSMVEVDLRLENNQLIIDATSQTNDSWIAIRTVGDNYYIKGISPSASSNYVPDVNGRELVIPLSSIPSSIVFLGGSGDDWITVDMSQAVIKTDIRFYGNDQRTSFGDGMSIIGNLAMDARYVPDAHEYGSGTIYTNANTIEFSGLEPIDITGFTTATIQTPPGGNDLLQVDNGFDFFSGGTNPALIVSGTVGGVGIESAALWNNGTFRIQTQDGSDNITINSANNGHLNANMDLDDGRNPGDVVNVGGPVALSDDFSITGKRVLINNSVTTAGAITVSSDRNLTLNGSAQVTTIDGDILIIGGTAPVAGDNFTGITINTGATIQATGTGDITIIGTGANSGMNDNTMGMNIQVLSNILSNSGSINLIGSGADGQIGLDGINLAGNVISQSGDIVINATAGNSLVMGGLNIGITIGSEVRTDADGSITISGQGGGGLGFSPGIIVERALGSPGNSILTSSGDITMNGVVDPNASGPENFGVLFGEDSLVGCSDSGNLNINGIGGGDMYENYGVVILGNTSSLPIGSVNGSVSIDGDSTATSGNDNDGVLIQRTVFAGGSGGMSVIGDAGGLDDAAIRLIFPGRFVVTETLILTSNNGPIASSGGIPSTGYIFSSFTEINGELQPGLDQSGSFPVDTIIIFSSGDAYSVSIESAGFPGIDYDQLGVTGVIDISGSTLNLIDNVPGVLAPTDTFTIINNDGSEPILGTFAGLPQGASIPFNGQALLIDYFGGDGNDVVLTVDTSPIAVCQDITVQLDATGNASITGADVDGGSTDDTGIASLSVSPSSFTCADIGTNTVTLTVTDIDGNTTTCTATVTVEDNVPPVALCQDITLQLDATGMATITAADVDDGSTDACGIASLSVSPNNFDCSDLGTNTVTLTVTDNNGNVSTCTATVTAEDNLLPVALCQDITVQLDATGNASITPTDIDAGTFDNCGIASLSVSPNTFDCSDVGANTITLTVTDVSGNVSTCTSTVTVEDNVPPISQCQDITVQLDGSGMVTITEADIDAGSSDACGIASLIATPDSFTCSDLGANTVTLTVTDVNGNVSTCTATVTIEDNIPPVIACPADITVDTDPGVCGANVFFPDALALDNCTVTVAQTGGLPSGFAFPIGVNTVEFTATDSSGNTAVCTFTITVTDNEPPVAVCQDITIQLDAVGNGSITAAVVDGGSTDNCGVASISASQTDFDCSDVGDNNVTLTVTDAQGNSATCVAVVAIEDVTDPVVICMDITVQLDVNGMATITPADVDGGSTDACGIASLSIDNGNFDCDDLGNNTVTLTVTDPSGNNNSCTANVTVEDNVDPILSCMDITVSLDENGFAEIVAEDVIDIVSDACGISSTTIDIFEFDCSDIGTPIPVTVFASDVNGNLASCTASVTVVDDLPPVVVCPLDQTVAPGAGNPFYTLPDYFTIGEATAADNCTGPVTNTDQDPAPGTELPDGTYTITLTTTDDEGNADECTFNLTVESVLDIGDVGGNTGTLVLYPNPATNIVYLSNPQILNLNDMMIYDMTGRLVQSVQLEGMGSGKAIDIRQLESATYMVMITGEDGQITKQLIIE